MADTEWFFGQNNRQGGPVSLEALQSMLATGRLSPNDLVWTEGMPEWTPASSIPILLPNAGLVSVEAEPSPPPAPDAIPPSGPTIVDYHTPPLIRADYAGFWLRFVAILVDYILITIAEGLISLFLRSATLTLPNLHASLPFVEGKFLLFMILRWLYFALMESSAPQGTLGKMLLKLKVTDLEGQRITFARATGRYFGKFLSSITLMIGFMMAGWTQRKQALHDLLANCLVVRKQ